MIQCVLGSLSRQHLPWWCLTRLFLWQVPACSVLVCPHPIDVFLLVCPHPLDAFFVSLSPPVRSAHPRIFKLRLGALIPRSVGLSVGLLVGLSVGRSSKNYKKNYKTLQTLQNIPKSLQNICKGCQGSYYDIKTRPPLKNEDDLKTKVNESIFYR